MESRKIHINSSGRSPEASDSEESSRFRVVDRRHFTEEGAKASVPAEDKPRYPTFVEELLAKVSETERRFAERVRQVDQEIARSKARLEADYERKLEREKQALLLPFLDVLDNLDRALQAAAHGESQPLIEGLKMTAGLFRVRLREQAVEPIEVLNQPFDPNHSQAVGVVPVSDPDKDGLVLDEVLPGYQMKGSLLRPAKVRVGQYHEEQGASA